MKARAIKPAYWKDEALSTWTPAQREFLIGCWMLADDAGVMRSDLWEIGAELFTYVWPMSRRMEKVQKLWDHVVAEGKVLPLECGRHAVIPSIENHPMGGYKSEHIRKQHAHRCVGSPDTKAAVARY